MTSVREIETGELSLLFNLFEYNNREDMLAENTRRINSGEIKIFGLFMGERLIGEIRAAFENGDERFAAKGRRAYLYAFRILEEYRGRGHGRFLINRAIEILTDMGYNEFTVGVEDDNEIARHMYFSLGFNRLIDRISEEY